MKPNFQLDNSALEDHRPLLPDPTAHVGIEAVCLFGSAARRQDAADSDLDVLVVVADSEDQPDLRRRARAIRESVHHSTQVSLLARESLRESFAKQTVFAAHLSREGQVVFDRDGELGRLFASHPKDTAVKESSARLLSQLDVYSDLSWCGGQYLFCFADFYAWSRSGAMLALARRREFEFDRELVFERFADAYPDLREDVDLARRLRPFWERVNRRGARPLPFPAKGSGGEATRARDACRAILSKSA